MAPNWPNWRNILACLRMVFGHSVRLKTEQLFLQICFVNNFKHSTFHHQATTISGRIWHSQSLYQTSFMHIHKKLKESQGMWERRVNRVMLERRQSLKCKCPLCGNTILPTTKISIWAYFCLLFFCLCLFCISWIFSVGWTLFIFMAMVKVWKCLEVPIAKEQQVKRCQSS